MPAGTRLWRKIALWLRDQHRPCWLHQYGMCKFNGAPIDYTAHHLHPMAFSADHRTPTSRGGLDTYDNAEASHRRCNCARHDDDIPALVPGLNPRTDNW